MTVVCVLERNNMRVLVTGSRDWTDYNEVIRSLTVIIEDMTYYYPEERKMTFVHTGQRGAETMVTEYVGKVEKFMRQKGYTIKEEIFKYNGTSELQEKFMRDYEMMSSGINSAIIFMKQGCKRSNYFDKILTEFQIPTRVIKG